MHTAVFEIEAILNSRPLFYVGSDDLDEPLNDTISLVVGHRILSLSYYELDGDEDFEVSSSTAKRRTKHLNKPLLEAVRETLSKRQMADPAVAEII